MDRPPHTRSKSSFSFRSNKSDRSTETKASKPKITDLVESPNEKRRSRFVATGKTNPNLAICEAQPSTQAQDSTTLVPLRSVQFKDADGNPIKDPDASNPGRSRFERPLDTIRSFEAAIDNSWRAKNPEVRSDQSEAASGYNSRRSSVVGSRLGYSPSANGMNRVNDPSANQRHSPGIYNGYGLRHPPYRNASYDASYQQYPPGYGPAGYGPPRRPYNPRMGSAPLPSRLSQEQSVYPSHGYQDSHDTVNTGTSSGSASEPWANSTDPSSENSSIDRSTAAKHMDTGDAYAPGPSGYGGSGYGNGYANGYANGYGNFPGNGYSNGQAGQPGNGYSNGNGNGGSIRGPIMEERWQDGRGYYHPPPQHRQAPSTDRPFAQNRAFSSSEQSRPSPYGPGPAAPQSRSQPMLQLQTPLPQPNVIKLGQRQAPQQQNGLPGAPAHGQKDKGKKLTRPPLQQRQPSASAEQPEKRKSWLRRAFSRRG